MKLLRMLAVVALCVSLTLAEEKKDKDKDLGTVIGIDLGTTYSWWVLYIHWFIIIYPHNLSAKPSLVPWAKH